MASTYWSVAKGMTLGLKAGLNMEKDEGQRDYLSSFMDAHPRRKASRAAWVRFLMA